MKKSDIFRYLADIGVGAVALDGTLDIASGADNPYISTALATSGLLLTGLAVISTNKYLKDIDNP